MKKRIKIVLIVLSCAIVFFPIPTGYKTRGTVMFNYNEVVFTADV